MTLQPVSLEACSYCGKPSEELVTYVDGVAICLGCRAKEQARIAASDAAYAAAGFDSMDPLTQRYMDGDR